MTAPTGSGRDDAPLRGALVLVVAIVIGVALLIRGGGTDGGDESADDPGPTTEVAPSTDETGSTDTLAPVNDSSTTEPAPVELDPATLTVVVLNASDQDGWAGENADVLTSAGYGTVDTGNFDSQEVSAVYATPEAQANATAVRDLLGLTGADISEKPPDPLTSDGTDADADIVVILGTDSI